VRNKYFVDEKEYKTFLSYVKENAGLSWHDRAASPLATVKHPGSSAGIVQQFIIVDLILDHTSILHMEG
jgi:hypothetical protein